MGRILYFNINISFIKLCEIFSQRQDTVDAVTLYFSTSFKGYLKVKKKRLDVCLDKKCEILSSAFLFEGYGPFSYMFIKKFMPEVLLNSKLLSFSRF